VGVFNVGSKESKIARMNKSTPAIGDFDIPRMDEKLVATSS
jgi:hypothetical protein